jgi:hypothetical protein
MEHHHFHYVVFTARFLAVLLGLHEVEATIASVFERSSR